MARPRTPRAKAAITARDQHDKKRFSNRKEPAVAAGVGSPPDWMGGEQRATWKLFAGELPWLNGSHRSLLEIATVLRTRLICGEEVGVQALNALRACLGQMGATPADASKVTVPDDGDEEGDGLGD